MDSKRPIRMQVHGTEDRRIDGILTLIEESSRVGPLADVLQRMCEQVAAIAHAEVVSVYVREEEDGRPVFVLRANIGFPREMIGNVRLELGEGITGFAAECLRPVSADVAAKDAHYKHFPQLGEEQYPSFLAIPLVMGGQASGVLNLQRREAGEFTPTEVALAAALATPFTLAIDRAQNRAGKQESHEAGRSARLTGTSVGRGQAVGSAQSALTFRALSEPTGPGQAASDIVKSAVTRVSDQITRQIAKIDPELHPDARRALAALSVTLQDARLISLMQSSCAELGVVSGMRKVARDYVAVPYMVGGAGAIDPWLSARAVEIEDLCLWVCGEACGDAGPGPGNVAVVAERLGAFGVMWGLSRGVSGILVGGAVELDSLASAIARAAKLPIVGEVAGLFAWVRTGDTLMVDADQGIVRVNPAASVLAQHRRSK